jgi:CBS-domain-containing membrane protein
VGGFHALPVIDRKRHLVGMVTSSDLIGVLVSKLDH